ncbi:glutathione S-transferase family protein [Alteromonadaceae bacterium BrNp21-10]|nr:glutathione S-transferase family protein [Alteromonadaceae bacterium BrNp21-10]
MNQVQIFGVQFSTYVRSTQLVCEEKGITYDISFDVKGKNIEFKSAEHEQLHPFRRIPVLLHGDKVLCESIAIIRYLDANFDGPKLTPEDPWLAAQVDEWCQLIAMYINNAYVRDYILELVFPKGEGGKPRLDVIQQNKPAALAALAILQQQLGDKDYLISNDFTLADAMAAPSLYYACHLPEAFALVEEHSPLMAYAQRLQNRASGKVALIPKA